MNRLVRIRHTPLRWAALPALVMAAALVLAPASQASAVTTTAIAAVANQVGEAAQITGILTDHRGRGVSAQIVTVTVSGGGTSRVTTDSAGRFSATLALPRLVAPVTLTASGTFAGNRQFAPSAFSTRFTYRPTSQQPPPSDTTAPTGGTQPTATAPAASASAETPSAATPTPSVTDLRIAAPTGALHPGDLFKVTGVLTADSMAVQDATLQLAVQGSADPSLSAVTNAAGQFTLQGQVPERAAAGSLKVAVIFDGAPGLAAIRTEGTITVATKPTPTPTPSATTSAEASPTPELAAVATEETAPPTAVASDEQVVTTTRPTIDPATFRTYALIGLGLVLTLGIFGGVAFVSRSKPEDEVTSFDRLID